MRKSFLALAILIALIAPASAAQWFPTFSGDVTNAGTSPFMLNALSRGACAVALLCLSPVASQARGRLALGGESTASPAISSLVARALSDLGRGNFTPFREAWCADAVSAWLTAIGRKPLASHMAASALAYGPLELHPRPGDLALIATRRGRYGHVAVVVADLGGEVEIVSGNWGRRVARARVPRRSVSAFVRVS